MASDNEGLFEKIDEGATRRTLLALGFLIELLFGEKEKKKKEKDGRK